MKIVVTHMSPDLDALCSTWLVTTFLPGWHNAKVEFVNGGETLNGMQPDENPDIIHVDTGMGKFDHHQTDKETSATRLVFEHLLKNDLVKKYDIDALDRMVTVVNRYDHFKEALIDEPNDDMHDFSLSTIIRTLNIKLQDNEAVMNHCDILFDALLIHFKNKVNAENAIAKGYEFTSYWGKTLALETENDETLKVSFRMGFDMCIRKSAQYGHIRIKLHPKLEKNLSNLEKIVREADPKATWYYHSSGKMFLNASAKNRKATPSALSLKKIIELVKSAT